MSFEDDLNAPFERDWATVDVMLGESLYTLRFTALDGLTWATECDKHPARPGVAFDKRYGYDPRGLTLGAAPLCGAVMNGETATELSEAQWAAFFARIDGISFKRITDVLFALNDDIPQKAVDAAKKALAVSVNQSGRQSSSASPRKGSTAGSRKKRPVTSTTKTVG